MSTHLIDRRSFFEGAAALLPAVGGLSALVESTVTQQNDMRERWWFNNGRPEETLPAVANGTVRIGCDTRPAVGNDRSHVVVYGIREITDGRIGL